MERLQEPVRVPQKESTDRSAAFPAYDSVRQSQGAAVIVSAYVRSDASPL